MLLLYKWGTKGSREEVTCQLHSKEPGSGPWLVELQSTHVFSKDEMESRPF